MNRSVGRNAMLLAGTSAGSYILGLARDRLLAQTFGASRDVDLFNSAFLLPDLIMNLFAAALTTAFIPVFAQLLKQGKAPAYQASNAILTVVAVALCLVDVVAFMIMPWITPLVAPGFSATELAQLTTLTRILLLSPLLFGISTLFGAILQGQHRFLAYALSPMLYNLGIVIGIIFFAKPFGIRGVVFGVVLGAMLHLIIRLVATLRLGYTPEFIQQSFKHPAVKQTLLLMGPRVIGLLAIQASLWTFNAIGSTLQPGSVAIFNFARNFQSLPVSFIGIALATVIFPVLASDSSELMNNTRKALRMIFFLTLPAMVGMMFVSQPLITVFLGGGAFDAAAIQTTAITLIVFSLLIPLESLQHILARAFYAKHDTKTPAVITIIGAVVNVIGCVVATSFWGVTGLAVGFVIMTLIIDILFVWKLPHIIDYSIIKNGAQNVVGCLVMAILVGAIKSVGVIHELPLLIGMAGTGIITYNIVMYLLKNQELSIILKQVHLRKSS
ncbi:MAG: murein biosynthesis integral membrane protein MurJ [Patescibacteria group bacterium]|jgi:putative peptidoglycan lipid II flippase